MKKTVIALSLMFVASGALADDVIPHATNKTVEGAQSGADTAKEKLHKTENRISEQKSHAQHKMKDGGASTSDKVKESSQKGWNRTKEGSEKAWDSTKEGSKKAWDSTKEGASSLKKKVTE
ncbi:hypothetical protein PMPD1_0217 [Paramixta manurensis]|uniref:Uncharacterized protein n=1 Tax=Paramixta manurensis TaxID=2740817 RepID=A0A6M8UC23_9GAMM|nr:hypothetical protein PMPD1_0217 [Erwiniaceae bacterium PD-1]